MNSNPYGIAHVRQEDERGCYIAVVAMLGGTTYQQMRDHYRYPCMAFFHCEREVQIAEFGWVMDRPVYRKDVTEWPPKPFADLHWCCVQVYESSPCAHEVLMLADGTVWDPLTTEPRTLDSYFAVHNVSALSKPKIA